MPVRMTEIIPQTPSGIAKINVDVGDILTEASFDAELGLLELIPGEMPAESRDFTQVGQILREMILLEVQTKRAIPEPPDIDVEPPIAKPPAAEVTPDVSQQMVIAPSTTPAIIAPTENADNEPKKAETFPFEPLANAQAADCASVRNVLEKPSGSEIPFAPKAQNNDQATEKRNIPVPEKKPEAGHSLAQPQSTPSQSTLPAPPNSVSTNTPDTSGDKLPESSLQKPSEVQRDFGDFGTGNPEKLQVHRPLPALTMVAPPSANRPQSAEVKIISQISTAISNTSKDTVEIRLDPPELGRVIISITQSDSGLSATVTSEKAEIADLLRRHSELLSRELTKSGFSEASLEFSHRDQQQDRSAFEEDKAQYSPNSPDQTEVTSAIENILRSQSGSLDIRL